MVILKKFLSELMRERRLITFLMHFCILFNVVKFIYFSSSIQIYKKNSFKNFLLNIVPIYVFVPFSLKQ